MTMKTLFPIVATLLVLAISGCAPQVDVEADTAAVKKWFDESTAALNANDGSIVDLGTEDAVVMYADAPAVTGRDALRARQQAIYDQATFEETRSVDEVVISGDWAFVRWAGTGTMTPKDGSEPSVFDRKGIAILQRQPDNSWKMARVIWNSNQPAASE
jgi:ketosteroid isomerase-like protein